MSTDKKQGVFKIGIIAIKVVLCICLVFNAFVFIYYGFINKGEVIKSDPVRYMENWKVEYSENGDQTAINDLPQNVKDYLSKPLDSKLLEKLVMNILPKEKVIISSQDTSEGPDIEGLDYETALTYCGGEEELFLEIASDISKECQERVERMRRSLETKDIDSYRIDEVTVQSSAK